MSRNFFAAILVACLLAVGLRGHDPVANAAGVGQFFLNAGESARNNVIEIKHRGRGSWPNLPIAPSYLAMIGHTTTTAVIIRRISVLAMSTLVIHTTTEAVIRDTAADAPIGPRSPCAELG